MGTKHRHYDVIVAWAAGEEVEIKDDDGVWVSFKNAKHVIFYEDMEYRIKPKRIKKEGWVNVYKNQTVGARIHPTEQDALKGKSIYDWASCIRIEWEEEE